MNRTVDSHSADAAGSIALEALRAEFKTKADVFY